MESNNKSKLKPKYVYCNLCGWRIKNEFDLMRRHLVVVHDMFELVKKGSGKKIRRRFDESPIKFEEHGPVTHCTEPGYRPGVSAAQREAERREREAAEERMRRLAKEDTDDSEKPYVCGQVVNGAPYVRIYHIPMGGRNKKY